MAICSRVILGSAILSPFALAVSFGEKPARMVLETDVAAATYIDDAQAQSVVFHGIASHSLSSSAPLETSAPSAVCVAPVPTLIATQPSEPAPITAVPTTAVATVVSATSPETLSTSTIPTAVISAAAPNTTPSTTSVAPAPTTSATSAGEDGSGAPASASDSATCEGKGNACESDITFYDGGLGACGANVDPTGNGIALPFAFMGTQSNGNPYCYRSLTIYNPATGVSAQAVVMDKCMGCDDRSIDLTPALFNTLTNNDPALGRVHDVDWWFN